MPKPPLIPPTPSEQESINNFIANINKLLELEGISQNELYIMCGTSPSGIKKVRNGSGNIISLIRVINSLGYEISFTKTKEKVKVAESLEATQRLIKFRKPKKDDTGKYYSGKRPTNAELQQRLREERAAERNFLK